METDAARASRLDLPAFIRSLAPDSVQDAIDKASELFEEPRGTVKSWLYRERLPHPGTAPKLIARSGGRMTYESIYAPPSSSEAAA